MYAENSVILKAKLVNDSRPSHLGAEGRRFADLRKQRLLQALLDGKIASYCDEKLASIAGILILFRAEYEKG